MTYTSCIIKKTKILKLLYEIKEIFHIGSFGKKIVPHMWLLNQKNVLRAFDSMI